MHVLGAAGMFADKHAAPAEEAEGANQPDCISIDDLVRAHVCRQWASLQHAIPGEVTVSILHPTSASAVEASKCSTPIRKLQPMLVCDLQVGWHHKGRVLYGELSVEPCMMVSVHTMVADESGQAVKLCLYNALPRKHSQQQIWELFRKGLKVAIKEPYFKVAMDGSHIIRVDNPADFIRNPKIRKGPGIQNNSTSTSLSPSSSPSTSTSTSISLSTSPSTSTSTSTSLSPSPSPLQCKVLLDAGDLRSRGNQAFASQDWKQAIQLYTDTVQLLLQRRGLSSSAISSEVSKELALAFSNRAEVRLRLKHFEAAKVDAGKALKLQPHHVKSLCRKGRALHGLHHYEEAVLCFKEAMDATDKNDMSMKDLTEALKSSEVCNKQAITGEYDLVRLWNEVEVGKEPVCGDFIGPVEIGPARERAFGRGLLVTKDVEPGDLLLVSKAVAHGKVYRSSGMKVLTQQGSSNEDIVVEHSTNYQDLTQQVRDRAMSSARFREQVYSLAANSTTGMGGLEINIPSMDLFSAKSESTRCDDISLNLEDIDDDKIFGVIRTNAFLEEDFADAEESHAALWLLPSFINHSCAPNASWMKLGKETLFVRAAHYVAKGQEVTISYIDNVAVPYSVRALVCQHYQHFDCRCERCDFEKMLDPFTKPFVSKFVSPLDTLGAAEVVESLEWAFQNTTAFKTERQKQWLRTSHSMFFISTLRDSSLQQRMSKFAPLETVLRAVHETLGGSEAFLQRLKGIVDDPECSPTAKGLLLTMYVCVYGKQPPATLRVLLGLRDFMMEKALFG